VRFRFFRPPCRAGAFQGRSRPPSGPSVLFSILRLQWARDNMDRLAQDKIRKRAYELWEQSGRPDGSEERFWHQADLELQGGMDRGEPARGSPDDI
jgi:hypothetical protein